ASWVEGQLGGREALLALAEHPEPPTWLRINPLVTTRERVADVLETYGVQTQPQSGVPMALEVLAQPPEGGVGNTLHRFAGHYHIQSLGSMVPPLLLDPQPGEVVL